MTLNDNHIKKIRDAVEIIIGILLILGIFYSTLIQPRFYSREEGVILEQKVNFNKETLLRIERGVNALNLKLDQQIKDSK